MQLTEHEWLTSTNPRRLVEHAPAGGLTERQLALFVVAACRPVAAYIPDGLGDRLLDAVERVAESLTGEHVLPGDVKRRDAELAELTAELDARYGPAGASGYDQVAPAGEVHRDAASAVRLAVVHLGNFRCHAYRYFGGPLRHVVRAAELAGCNRAARWARLAELVREVAGNPFRPVSLDPGWLTSTVVALAGVIYQGRAFGSMPVLADALQDAGCGSEDVLRHCRDNRATQVRGCWVLDLLRAGEVHHP